MKRGIAFGVFDGLHQGHKNFLTQAAEKCNELIVVVARDEVVETLKGRPPRYRFEERARAIAQFNPTLKIVPSEKTLGTWNILDEVKPDIIFLGFDQLAIASELNVRALPFVMLKPYRPEKFKSSLLT